MAERQGRIDQLERTQLRVGRDLRRTITDAEALGRQELGRRFNQSAAAVITETSLLAIRLARDAVRLLGRIAADAYRAVHTKPGIALAMTGGAAIVGSFVAYRFSQDRARQPSSVEQIEAEADTN